MAEGKASCALGTDCTDCGAREICHVPGAPSLRLPRASIPAPASPAPALRTSEVLFMVLGSAKYHHRSVHCYQTWCQQGTNVTCLFFADDSISNSTTNTSGTAAVRSAMTDVTGASSMPLVIIKGVAPPKQCCAKKRSSSGKLRPNFFCTAHRATTLRAQYRYLPALEHVRSSRAFRTGSFRWVVMVDDDAFVFVQRLVWILSRLNSSAPLYLGDFGSSGEATALHPSIPHFACGGGGSVLSVAALRAMDLRACRRAYHAQCMQSDWMIGGCARRYGVMELRELGCGTCDPRRIKDRRYVSGVRTRLHDGRCFFLQQASPVAAELLSSGSVHSAAIVHGLNELARSALFRQQHQREVSTWSHPSALHMQL